MSDRLKAYKNNGKTDTRVKRVEASIELRKSKREDQMSKRRNIAEDLEDEDAVATTPDLGHSQITIAKDHKEDAIALTLEHISKGLMTTDAPSIQEAARAAREILSRGQPPIDDFVKFSNGGLVSRLVSLLSPGTPRDIQIEASWALTNIASGNEAQVLVLLDAGVLEPMLNMIDSGDLRLVEQAIWALANIVGTGADYRDQMLKEGIVDRLASLLEKYHREAKMDLLGTIIWFISNLCRKMNRSPDWQYVRPSIPLIKKYFLGQVSDAVLSDACWALSYLTGGDNESIFGVLEDGSSILARLIELVGSSTYIQIVVPALRTLGNIATGSEMQTQMLIDAGIVPVLRLLMRQTQLKVHKEVLWILSNILAGSPSQVSAVLSTGGMLDILIEQVASGDTKCRCEATWGLTNITCCGCVDDTASLVRAGALGPLTSMLDPSVSADAKLLCAILDAFGNIIRVADELGALQSILDKLEECGFVEKAEYLQMHGNNEVYKRAASLIETFWGDDDADEKVETTAATMDFNLAANEVADGHTFTF